MDETMTFEAPVEISRPKTLKMEGEYLLQIRQNNGHRLSFQLVRFCGFTTCPGVVLIQYQNGGILRVSRGDIFIANASS